MPCFLTECDPFAEAKRFGLALGGLYVYHYVVDTVFIRPAVRYMLVKGWLTKDKEDKMRESLYKNAAVGAFHLFGLYIGWHETWFLNKEEYFKEFPNATSEAQRWYYMIYLSFWLQSIDFMLNLTNTHYTVKRKDNAEMIVHHVSTISLMLFSYCVDLTKIGHCVLMIHDVNDLLLETAKVFVYLQWETVANIFFGLFALVWFLLRWFFYSYNILHSAYAFAYRDIVASIMEVGSYRGIDASVWYATWVVWFGFLCLLLALHVYWGVLIVKMVIKALDDGNVEKDIRSDSEDEQVEEKEDKQLQGESAISTPRRRRAPKAE
uniref:TLC domain-containing protein n=1 Tax=Peronospora matthiolae TaxID=2874970 RepID=A0AAV1V5N7_9STRA